MFDTKAEQWAPQFILNDKNGYAVAKAIEAALQVFNNTVEQGLKCIADVKSMPEWRLDELAWEYNLLYDESADIETKRQWIDEALLFYALSGTAAGIEKYLKAAFNTAMVEEWFAYGGDPFHFRVTVSGQWSAESNAWAYETIERIKNVRSLLDSITFNSQTSYASVDVLTAITDIEIVETSQTAGGI